MKRLSNILMVAAIALAVVGTGVAIVKPGDLGDDAKTETADQPADDPAIDDPVGDDTADDDPAVDDDGSDVEDDPVISAPDDDDTTTDSSSSPTSETTTSEATAPSTTAPSTTASGGGQSGFDADGAADPVDTSNGLADTGGTSMILAGAALAMASLAIRRRRTA